MRFIKPIVIVEGMETFCGRRRLSRWGEDAVARRAEPLPVPLPPLWADLSLNWLPCLYTPLLLVSQPSNFSRSPGESVSLWPINRKCFNLSWVLTLWRSLYSFIMQMRWILKFLKSDWYRSLLPNVKGFPAPPVFVGAPLWKVHVVDYKVMVFCSPRNTFFLKKGTEYESIGKKNSHFLFYGLH